MVHRCNDRPTAAVRHAHRHDANHTVAAHMPPTLREINVAIMKTTITIAFLILSSSCLAGGIDSILPQIDQIIIKECHQVDTSKEYSILIENDDKFIRGWFCVHNLLKQLSSSDLFKKDTSLFYWARRYLNLKTRETILKDSANLLRFRNWENNRLDLCFAEQGNWIVSNIPTNDSENIVHLIFSKIYCGSLYDSRDFYELTLIRNGNLWNILNRKNIKTPR
jgi:hypothetical protein